MKNDINLLEYTDNYDYSNVQIEQRTKEKNKNDNKKLDKYSFDKLSKKQKYL